MKSDVPSYRGYRFPPEIISHAVWLYHRFCVSFRDVEELLAQRGITVSYEALRLWCFKFWSGVRSWAEVDVITAHLKSKLLTFGGNFSTTDETLRAQTAYFALKRGSAEATSLREHATALMAAGRNVVLPLSSVAQAARSISKTVAVGVLRGSAMVIIVTNKDGREHTNTSRKVSRRLASPACIAGVRVSLPNFRARCGRTKL